jgi:hypothetical protein
LRQWSGMWRQARLGIHGILMLNDGGDLKIKIKN